MLSGYWGVVDGLFGGSASGLVQITALNVSRASRKHLLCSLETRMQSCLETLENYVSKNKKNVYVFWQMHTLQATSYLHNSSL